MSTLTTTLGRIGGVNLLPFAVAAVAFLLIGAPSSWVTLTVAGQAMTFSAPEDLSTGHAYNWLGIGGLDSDSLDWTGAVDGVRVSSVQRYSGTEIYTSDPLPAVDVVDLGLWHFQQNLENAAAKSAPPLEPLRGSERYTENCPE